VEEILEMQKKILTFIELLETRKSSINKTQENVDGIYENETSLISKAILLLKVNNPRLIIKLGKNYFSKWEVEKHIS